MASWLVKLLLERGYVVKGTVRNPDDSKNNHLRQFEGAKERLILCKADLLDYNSLLDAFNGCDGVFHTASPVANDLKLEVIDQIIEGTKNVMNASAEARVGRVVYTSTIGAVHMDTIRRPDSVDRNPDVVVDESCWSDLEYCKKVKNWYCYAKTNAEQEAWELSRKRGVGLVVVIPVTLVGPLLQPNINTSTLHILKYLNGQAKTYGNAIQVYAHVKDAAEAHILVYENPAASGRYLCGDVCLHRADVVRTLAELFPQYPVPTQFSDKVNPRVKPYKFVNHRIKDLGLRFTPFKQGLYEMVKSLQEKGHIPVNPPLHSSI